MQSPNENLRETADDCEPDKPGPSASHANIHVDRLNVLWLQRNQELTPIQRLGFALWSCIFLIPGVACISGVISEKDPAVWIAISLLLLRSLPLRRRSGSDSRLDGTAQGAGSCTINGVVGNVKCVGAINPNLLRLIFLEQRQRIFG